MFDLSRNLWMSITSFGGAGLTVPLALMIAIWLFLGYSPRRALTWLVVLGADVCLVVLTKIAFLGWGIGVREWDFTGVSGHTMMSSAVYPVVMFLLLARAPNPLRVLGILCGLALGVAVGLSRVALDAHSPSEAISGCVCGALAALCFIALTWRAEPHRWSMPAVGISLMVVTFALYGVSVPSQRWVTKVSLHLSGHKHPYVRARWRVNPDYRPAAHPVTSPLRDTRFVAEHA